MDNPCGPKAPDMANPDLGAREHKCIEGEGQANHECEVQCSLRCRCRVQEARLQGLLHLARGVALPGQGCTLRVAPLLGQVK